MNTYYLHNGIESSGPFTLEELKIKKITPKTPVWCQGMTDWKTAADIEELKNIIFITTPPPLNKNTVLATPAPTNEVKQITDKKRTKSTRIFGLKKSVFFLVTTIGILVIASLFLNLYQENRRAELELINKQTEKNNVQYRLQQKEIEENKIQLAIQEKIEADRIINEKKERLKNKLFINQESLIVANTNFENAKKKLADAGTFKFFRSPEERDEQIDQAQKEVAYWKAEIEKITTENNQLKLELEKVH